MAEIANTRKVFNFRVEIDGINQFEVQKISIPAPEIESVAHGGTNHDIKTAGRVSVEDLELEKLRPLPNSDTWAMEWLESAQSMRTGGGQLPSQYKKTIIIRELSPAGATVNTWVCTGAWVRKAKQSKLDRKGSDNTMEVVTISVDKVYVV